MAVSSLDSKTSDGCNGELVVIAQTSPESFGFKPGGDVVGVLATPHSSVVFVVGVVTVIVVVIIMGS